MDFQQGLAYLYGLQQFGIKLGLDNMHALAERLPQLQRLPKTVHVAGTNGKGSVCAFLAEMLRQGGYRVGLYTSPHLSCFTERIRFDGTPITQDEAARLIDQLREASDGIPITFFEATTALALLAFVEQKVDCAVIETGMGGRLDATNIVSPLLSLITPVSLDHQTHLGHDLAAIAAEKAGIIKPGVPVVVGRQQSEAEVKIRAIARSQDAPTLFAGEGYSWEGDHHNLSVTVDEATLGDLTCVLPGRHQLDNLAQAVAAAVHLRRLGLAINDGAIRRGAHSVAWPGRLEWWGNDRQLLLDAAHNPAGAGCLAAYLAELGYRDVRLVFGLTGDRNAMDILAVLKPVVGQVFAVPVPGDAGLPPQEVMQAAHTLGLDGNVFEQAVEGLQAAIDERRSGAPVVVCGSIYLIAEVREALLEGVVKIVRSVS